MRMESREFLERLLDAPGPSGFEQKPANVWRDYARGLGAEMDSDVLGNSYARLSSTDGPLVVIEGHIDEIGLMITHVDEQGFLWFDTIGGWDTQILTGQRVLILGSGGADVIGTVGRKAAHSLSEEDRRKAPKTTDLWIDIGATDRSDALKRVEIGDPMVVFTSTTRLSDDLIVSRSLDNRVGAFVAIEALRLLQDSPPEADVYALAATQEEVSFAGALTATHRLQPALCIVIDVTHATDYPSADKKRDGEIRLGGGPVLTRGASLNPVAYDLMTRTARDAGIPVQLQGAPRSSGTDADAMIRAGSGTATALVSIPNRYMHSPNEVVSLTDLERAAELTAACISQVTAETDFRP